MAPRSLNLKRLYKDIILILVSLLLLSPSVVFAQEKEDELTPSEMKKIIEKEDTEVVEVRGRKFETRIDLKKQVNIAELNFFERFNELAEDERFKVSCRREAYVGSRLKRQICYPRYILDSMAEATQDALAFGNSTPTMKEVAMANKRTQREHFAYIEALAKKHPELIELIEEMNTAQSRLKAWDDSN